MLNILLTLIRTLNLWKGGDSMMNIKATMTVIGIVAMFTTTPASVFAQTVTPAPVNQQNLSFMQNLYSSLKNFESQNSNYVRREGIVVTGISGTTITGTLTNKKKNTTVTYTINAGSATVVRRFWAQSSLSQVSVGDRLRVIGTWVDSSKTAINAYVIRDMSIQERADTFGGTVTSLGNNSFTLQSLHRGSWTVNVTNSTKITGKKNVSMQFSNIQTNDKLRIDGMLDRTNKIITATAIRDISYH